MIYYKAMNLSLKPLKFAPGVWADLISDLKRRGKHHRESGAFLLAQTADDDNIVRTWLPYDVLAPESLNYAYVRLEPVAFSRLWAFCSKHQMKVIADVHTHPKEPVQSLSDRSHPMIALNGHIAIIVPNFAQNFPRPFDCSFNVYLGNNRWVNCYREQADKLIYAP